MKNLRIILLLFGTFLIFISNIEAQDSIEVKIQKMLELTGAKERFDMVIDQLIAIQQENSVDIVGEEFFDAFREKLGVEAFDELSRRVTPVYLKHLTEEEIDGIIVFYESDIGKSLIEKMPLITSETMVIGEEWGEEIGKEIANEAFFKSKAAELEQKFYSEIEEDCTKFREGKFVFYLPPDSTAVEFIRKDNKQIEISDGEELEYEVDWISNNRYLLIGMQKNYKSMPSDTLVVNIYQATENSYKYISKLEGDSLYATGEVFKIE